MEVESSHKSPGEFLADQLVALQHLPENELIEMMYHVVQNKPEWKKIYEEEATKISGSGAGGGASGAGEVIMPMYVYASGLP